MAKFPTLPFILSVCLFSQTLWAADNTTYITGADLTLSRAIQMAQAQDPWQQSNISRESAVSAKSIAADTLPDPKISLALANMPVDSFDFNQEAMTQFKVGVTQMLPRGDINKLQQEQLAIDASQYPLMRKDRQAKVAVEVTQLWLDLLLANKTIELLVKNKELVAQLVNVVESNYGNASGNTQQQDVLGAQLQLIQIEDRIISAQSNQEVIWEKLNRWLRLPVQTRGDEASNVIAELVSEQLPEFELSASYHDQSIQHLAPMLLKHPGLQTYDKKHQILKKGIEVAEQGYKPQWSFNASYALRDDSDNNMQRPDFLSVGVTLDLPLFTDNKQDQEVIAAKAQSEAIKTDKELMFRKMYGQLQQELRQLARLEQRKALYNTRLLNQATQQSAATLTSYTNASGPITDVLLANITELNAQISSLTVDVQRLKTIARINYYFVGTGYDF